VKTLKRLHDEFGDDLYFEKVPKTTYFWKEWFESEEDKAVRNYWKADFLLRAGKNTEAIALIDSLINTFHGKSLPPIVHRKYNELLAVAWLRYGETENCIQFHSDQSCIVPIQGDGFHKLEKGSRKAIEAYKKLLDIDSLNYKAMLLMNIAYMTLNNYPDSVPKPYLIPLTKFPNDTAVPLFKNIAGNLGLNTRSNAGGVIMEDFNNDGYLDVVFSGMHLDDQLQFFVNNGDGSLTEATIEAGLKGITGGLNIMQADYNNDGLKDILILRGGWYGKRSLGFQPNSLLKNLGNNRFEDVTVETGLLSLHATQTATWADFNNDGWLDLFIGNESELHNHPCELFMNLQGKSFKEMALAAGIDVNTHIKGVTAADYDNDGWTDLFLSNFGGKNHLFKNKGLDKNEQVWFEDDTSSTVAVDLQSFPCWFWDYNNDGNEDLMVFRFKSRHSTEAVATHLLGQKAERSIPVLYKNDGQGNFTETSANGQLVLPLTTMGCNFGDVNNDGYLDMYIGTGAPSYEMIYPNRLLINSAEGKFYDATVSSGTGHLQKGHGIAIGDLDNDGDQDILAEMGGFYQADVFANALFLNPGNDNNWVKLQLEGVTSNRDAIGSKIKVTVLQDSIVRNVYRTVSSGSSFGANSFRAEIGLGAADSIKSIEVFWPTSNTRQVFTGVTLNQSYKVKEGEQQLVEVHAPGFRFSDSTTTGHHHHLH